MPITEKTIFVTSDGREWDSQNEAQTHEFNMCFVNDFAKVIGIGEKGESVAKAITANADDILDIIKLLERYLNGPNYKNKRARRSDHYLEELQKNIYFALESNPKRSYSKREIRNLIGTEQDISTPLARLCRYGKIEKADDKFPSRYKLCENATIDASFT